MELSIEEETIFSCLVVARGEAKNYGPTERRRIGMAMQRAGISMGDNPKLVSSKMGAYFKKYPAAFETVLAKLNSAKQDEASQAEDNAREGKQRFHNFAGASTGAPTAMKVGEKAKIDPDIQRRLHAYRMR